MEAPRTLVKPPWQLLLLLQGLFHRTLQGALELVGLGAHHSLRYQGSDFDVILRCKQFMSSSSYYKTLEYIRIADTAKLPSAVPQSCSDLADCYVVSM